MKHAHQATHPMIIVAATATTIASLAATAYFTGMLPTKAATESPFTVTAPAPQLIAATPAVSVAAPVSASQPTPPAAPKPRPEVTPKPRPAANEPAAQRVSYDDAPIHPTDWRYANERNAPQAYSQNDNGIDIIPAHPAVRATAPSCYDCGTIEALREVSTPTEASGLGAIAGGVLGGLLGNQVGKGRGSQVGAVVGALGGAFAGHQAEKHFRAEKQIEVTVRLDDGSSQTTTLSGPSRWRAGDRVRLSNGSLLPV